MNPSARPQLRLSAPPDRAVDRGGDTRRQRRYSRAEIGMNAAHIKFPRHRTAATLSAVAAVATAAAGPAALVAPAAAHEGPRVTVALYGDSVVEGYTVPNFLQNGLSPLLEDGLVAAGFSRGGTGLIPATPFRWKLKKNFVIGGMGSQPAGGWLLNGFGTQTGLNGPSGYSARATSPQATATAPIDSQTVAVLFTKYAGGPTFTASAGGQTWPISTDSTGPAQPSELWLNIPAGATTLTITGPASGQFTFDGAIDRQPVAPGTVQTEVEDLGHMGHLLGQDLTQLVQESIVQQRFNVSVFLGGYLYIEEANSQNATRRAREYESNLRKYVNLIRTYHGKCLIADPTPLPAPGKVVARFDAIDRDIAQVGGCTYTSALTHLWVAKTSIQKKLTLVDGIHPTAAGYKLIVKALMPTLKKLVHASA
jgi:lysophospholipase L1-like esterase